MIECGCPTLRVEGWVATRDGMVYPPHVPRRLLVLIFFALFLSCRSHTADLQVRALYSAQNPALLKLQQAQREFSFTDPRLHSGKPFVIRETTAPTPAAAFSDRATSNDIDLFILRSAAELPEQADLRKELGDSFSVCDQSVAYIPEWVNEERREGAARFLQYLSTHCR